MTESHTDRNAGERSADDRVLEDYLHRKSALSMGYRRVYVEAPPPELDRAITARARRALRFLVPGLLSVGIVLALVIGINVGVTKWVGVLKSADQTLQKQSEERRKRQEEERRKAPIAVIVDPNELKSGPAVPLTREQWQAKIDALQRAGKKREAAEELRRFKEAYGAEAGK